MGVGGLELSGTDAAEALERLIRHAEECGASDVHLQMVGRRAEVAFRLDGVLTEVGELPDALAPRIFGRIKYLARLKTYQESLPQEGRIAREDLGSSSDIRVATYPTVVGEKIVLRLFRPGTIEKLGELGFPAAARRALERFLGRPSGMLLLTGPAGSGKTTTIYACLRHVAERGNRHIITVEDPAEQLIPGVMQTEVRPQLGLTFAEAARHLLRQDPEVLVIGEIRDEETASIAVRAAFTGHVVISTLHAGSCSGVFDRLFELCDDRHAAAAAVEMVINQRLMRTLCRDCSGDGCEGCLGTGYRGRRPVVEWFLVDDGARKRLRERGPEAVRPEPTLEAEGRRLVAEGVTDERESARVFGP